MHVAGRQVVLPVLEVELSDDHAVGHDADVVVGDPNRRPNGAGIVGAGENVEQPHLVGVGDSGRLSAQKVQRRRGVAAVFGVEAVLLRESAHSLHGAACGVAALERHLCELRDPEHAVAVGQVVAPPNGLSSDRALGDRHLFLVHDAIVAVPVCIRLPHLRDEARRLRQLLTVQRLVVIAAAVSDNPRVLLLKVQDGPRSSLRIRGSRNLGTPDRRLTSVVSAARLLGARGSWTSDGRQNNNYLLHEYQVLSSTKL
mmetsp:Transcript_36871/g.95613  ORF Transcript_36871/g.95613 Transcript_36871/m.95613 type:complete len:256 (-) Transcript_36871:343-1110(-)